MNEKKDVYTTAELQALGAVKKPRTHGIKDPLDVWKLWNTFLLFHVIWSDGLKKHPAYAEVFREAKLDVTTKDLTTALQQPTENRELDELSLDEVA